MTGPLRILALLLASLLLTACGGDDGGDDPKASSKGDSKAQSREGYFGEEQSDALNPSLAEYSKASDTYYKDTKACDAEADRLFKAGKGPRASVKCHLDMTKGLQASITGVRTKLDAIDGEFREECTAQREAFSTFLATYEKSVASLLADWNTYASGKPVPKAITSHSKAVDDNAATMVNEQIPAMSEACYTKSDREAAGKS